MKNRLLLVVAILTMLALLAACGGPAPAEQPRQADQAKEQADQAKKEVEKAADQAKEQVDQAKKEVEKTADQAKETAPKAGCDDALGCVVVAPGDPIKLAGVLVLSGANESLGVDAQNGIKVAIKERDKVAGHPIELVSQDDTCSAEGGQTAATKIASDSSIVAVVGHSCSSSCTPAAPIYNDAGLTMIAPSCTAPALTAEATHVASFLRTAYNDKAQGRVMAEFVYNKLGLRSAATIHDGSPYSEQLVQVFADTFTELGGKITAQEAINVGDTDMRPVLTSIATGKPEFLYYPVFVAEGGFITVQSREVAGMEKTVLAGGDGMIGPQFVSAAGAAGENMYISGPSLDFSGERYDKFKSEYKAISGQEPFSAFHAHAYDAANMVFAAIEKVAKTDADGNTVIGRQALRDALYATKDFDGITGKITCNPTGDCADTRIAINQIQKGQYVQVYQGGQGGGEEAKPAETKPEATAEAKPAEAKPEAATEKVDIKPIRIAVVMPSTITDMAWTQSLYDSLIKLQKAAGGPKVVDIAYTENMFNVTDAAAAIRDYATNGYNIVIAHGAQYGTSLFEIAPDFPKTSFAWGTTTNFGKDEGLTNVFALEPRGDEGGYVMGVLAAKLTKSGVIGLVGPIDAGDAKLHVDGFVAGVRDTNPKAKVNVSFTGSFGDTSLAAEAANTQISAGADILTGSSQQVVGAIGVAKEKGIPWLGFQADQSSLAPEVVKGTVIYDWQPLLLDMIKMHQAGEMGGKVLQLTLANGGEVPVYADGLPADAVDAAKAAAQGIIDGKIKIVAEKR